VAEWDWSALFRSLSHTHTHAFTHVYTHTRTYTCIHTHACAHIRMMRCSVLQCVAVCCSVLQCVACAHIRMMRPLFLSRTHAHAHMHTNIHTHARGKLGCRTVWVWLSLPLVTLHKSHVTFFNSRRGILWEPQRVMSHMRHSHTSPVTHEICRA